MIETRTIHVCKNGKRLRKAPEKRASAAQERKALTAYQKRKARKERALRHVQTFSDGVTRCSKCPKPTPAQPHRFCAECEAINNARQIAGLIRPRDDPRPHPNNCLPCVPTKHSYQGGKPLRYHQTASEPISIEVIHLGGGWYLGQALLKGEPIYERKFRSRDEARRYAVNSMIDIREGLRFEALLNG